MRIILIFLITMLLTGCNTVPPSLQVMDPFVLNRESKVHVPAVAYLYWQKGAEFAQIEKARLPQGDIVAALIAVGIDYQMRQNQPGRFSYSYGKAQQAVFMTSLKNTLNQQNIFKQTNFVTDLNKKLLAHDVLLIFNFKHTRVTGNDYEHHIVLDLEMTIQSNNKPLFTRTYFVQTTEAEIEQGLSYKALQASVSKRLVGQVVIGIEQWAQQKS